MEAKLNVYLIFEGKCEEAFLFYKSVFGGEFAFLSRFKDMPEGENPVPEKVKEKIMYISLPIFNNSMVLMGSDSMPPYASPVIQGGNMALNISPSSEDQARDLFKALSEGGVIEMPLEVTFWGALYASFTDRYGINWMINYRMPNGE